MHNQLQEYVCEANLRLWRSGLTAFTWGNASGVSREDGVIAIKPSGVCYDQLTPEKIVLLTLKGERINEGLLPSSDTSTHLILYRKLPELGGIVHTHSKFATAFAQAKRSIPPLGTTHADYFYGEVPCTRELTLDEVNGSYELNTGLALVEALEGRDPMIVPGALVAGHGPFAWGRDALEAAENAAYLEIIAEIAFYTMSLGNDAPIQPFLLDRHYHRKHGNSAYYGQKENTKVDN